MMIPVSGGKYYAIIDETDYEIVSPFSWTIKNSPNGRQYARTSWYGEGSSWRTGAKQHSLFMHNLISEFRVVDHINHNGLDNRRENLRDGSGNLNLLNTRKRMSTTSQYKGVFWNSQKWKWQAKIQFKNKQTHLGFYRSEEQAAKAYDLRASELFGEYANLNFPEALT